MVRLVHPKCQFLCQFRAFKSQHERWQTCSDLERESVVVFYESDDLRFTAPTFISDTIRVEREVLETDRTPELPGMGTIRYRVDVIKDDDTTVLSCEMASLIE